MLHHSELGAAGNIVVGGSFPLDTPIGTFIEGGYFGGFISHTADGVPTHALIVSPKAQGYTTATLDMLGPDVPEATSLFDGASNTGVLIGISSHAAAVWCAELTINGYSDWYLPAIMELHILYVNLKPLVYNNTTSFGINDYSIPKRLGNYSLSDPAQTSIIIFQEGNSEAFPTVLNSQVVSHWSSTKVGSYTYRLGLRNGYQSYGDLAATYLETRAIRRVEV